MEASNGGSFVPNAVETKAKILLDGLYIRALQGHLGEFKAYKQAGVPDNFSFFIEPDTGHVLTETMWQHVKVCFDRHLSVWRIVPLAGYEIPGVLLQRSPYPRSSGKRTTCSY